MTDEVKPAGPQLICGKNDCTRANRLREALEGVVWLADKFEVIVVGRGGMRVDFLKTATGKKARDALKEDQ